MGKLWNSIFEKYINPYYYHYGHRRKQWIKSITHDIVTETPNKQVFYKYTLPSDKWPLDNVLTDAIRRNMSVQACYMNTSADTSIILKNDFPVCSYIKDDTLAFIKKYIFPNIHFYVSMFDDRILSFIDTLYNDVWRLVVQSLLSTPITDIYQKKIPSMNRIYLDECDYIIERLLPHNTQTNYGLYHLFYHLIDTLKAIYDTDNICTIKLIHEILMDIHLEPFKKSADIRYELFQHKYKHRQKYLSIRFHMPKMLVTNLNNHFEEIEEHKITVLSERAKRIG
jgi:hypothetical protein